MATEARLNLLKEALANLLVRSKRDIIQSGGCNELVERGDGFDRYF